METTTATAVKTCQCGCGAPVARRFLPGHDAKLKGRLLAETKSSEWWVREAAIDALIDLNWGHFINPEILAFSREVGRHNGRFVESRHIEVVGVWNLDAEETIHSHTACPAIVGKVTKTQDRNAGWVCGKCTHTATKVEMVGMSRMNQVLAAA